MILFLCNGERPECDGSCGCHKNGGECKHTKDPAYAKNFYADTYFDGVYVEYIECENEIK